RTTKAPASSRVYLRSTVCSPATRAVAATRVAGLQQLQTKRVAATALVAGEQTVERKYAREEAGAFLVLALLQLRRIELHVDHPQREIIVHDGNAVAVEHAAHGGPAAFEISTQGQHGIAGRGLVQRGLALTGEVGGKE